MSRAESCPRRRFRWRDPEGYVDMHRRAWRFLRQKLLSTTGRGAAATSIVVPSETEFSACVRQRCATRRERHCGAAALGSLGSITSRNRLTRQSLGNRPRSTGNTTIQGTNSSSSDSRVRRCEEPCGDGNGDFRVQLGGTQRAPHSTAKPTASVRFSTRRFLRVRTLFCRVFAVVTGRRLRAGVAGGRRQRHVWRDVAGEEKQSRALMISTAARQHGPSLQVGKFEAPALSGVKEQKTGRATREDRAARHRRRTRTARAPTVHQKSMRKFNLISRAPRISRGWSNAGPYAAIALTTGLAFKAL